MSFIKTSRSKLTYFIQCLIMLFWFAIVISGCKQKTGDVNIKDLKTACDHVDAIEKLILNSADKIKLTKEQGQLAEAKNEYNELKKKVDIIETSAMQKFDPSSLKDCQNYQKVELLYREFIK